MKHNNPSFSEWLYRTFNMKSTDVASNEVLDYLTPVVRVQPTLNTVKVATCTNATSANIFTTPSGKDFYLSAISLSIIKDVTATSTYSRILAYVDGVQIQIANIACLTLTVQNDSMYLYFDNPIKIDRNTIISIGHSTNVANMTSTAILYGYTVEVMK